MYHVRDRKRSFLITTYLLYIYKVPKIIKTILIVFIFNGIFVNGSGLSRSILS